VEVTNLPGVLLAPAVFVVDRIKAEAAVLVPLMIRAKARRSPALAELPTVAIFAVALTNVAAAVFVAAIGLPVDRDEPAAGVFVPVNVRRNAWPLVNRATPTFEARPVFVMLRTKVGAVVLVRVLGFPVERASAPGGVFVTRSVFAVCLVRNAGGVLVARQVWL